MFVLLKLCALVLGIGAVALSVSLHFVSIAKGRHLYLTCLFAFLSGFAVISFALFVLAFFDVLHLWTSVALLTVFSGAGLFLGRNKFDSWFVRSFVVFCLGVAALVVIFNLAMPPYQAFLRGDDASVYLGAAVQFGKTGQIRSEDRVVEESTRKERYDLFFNRFRNDSTGLYMRFPGGVRLLEPEKGTITFGFYHMFPIWLSFGYQLFGAPDFVGILSLFGVLSLLSVAAIGSRLAGPLAGICSAIVLSVFYPQIFFSRMPVSEILAQALFLSGLAAFMQDDDRENQRLAGLLWGSLLLTRVDALLLIPFSLGLIFTLAPWLNEKQNGKRMLVVLLAFFAMTAVLHQLRTGQYLFVDFPIRGPADVVERLFNWLRILSALLLDYPAVPALLFVFLAFAAVFIVRLREVLPPKYSRFLLYALTVVSALVFVWLLPKVTWNLLKIRFSWLTPHTTPGLLAGLLAGALFLPVLSRERSNAVRCLVFFLVPFSIFLVSPILASVHQPWVTRRFVPIAFPLLIVLGCCGWQWIIRAVLRPPLLRAAAYCCITFSFAFVFSSRSAALMSVDLYSGVYEQVKELAARIPDGSLVVVPDGIADVHAQLPLQFLFERDMLLVPLHRSKSFVADSFWSYMDRALDKNARVFVLSPNRAPSFSLLDDYRLIAGETSRFSFYATPQGAADRLPQKPVAVNMNLRLFEVVEKRPRPMKQQLAYDDPDLVFSGFHEKANGYRWTSHWSDISRFNYPTGSGPTILKLTVARDAKAAWANPAHWRVFVNDWLAATFMERKGADYYFRVPPLREGRIMRVSISSQTFQPRMTRKNTKLGIPLASITFLQDSDSLAPDS